LPARVTRLRLVGFKSFAEPAVIDILPGLTGIVGPNGCGKSNVVDALRFVMGETSARSIRGGEMEDVIFAGTAARPARNLAEVALTLEAGEEPLPTPFHAVSEIVISRGVERGRGSAFRINGEVVRARDVQTLLADLASGARSSALVSQGRVTALISARPEERRALLEEAAGITGLHARRHEAELKLQAAEANLARAEEIKAGLEEQLANLRRQARQASRYRNLGGAIQTAEGELLAIERAQALADRAAAAAELDAARASLAQATEEAVAASARAAETAARLPGLRDAEAEARTALERTRLSREQIESEVARARESLTASEMRLAEIERDLGHSAALAADADAALARLQAENEEIAMAAAAAPEREAAVAAAFAAAAAEAAEAEAASDQAAEAAASLAARVTAFDREHNRTRQRLDRLGEERARLARERERLLATRPDPAILAELASAEEAAEAKAAETRAAREQLEMERQAAAAEHERARAALAAAEGERTRLAAEAEALAAVLAVGITTPIETLADKLTVPSGLEAALAAALGETLEAEFGRWRALPPLAEIPPLPEGAMPLASLLSAPPMLARTLAFIGLVAAPEDAAGLQERLAPGQSLISREGGLWRWDGYSVPPGTKSAAAVRLAERNRLAAVRGSLASAETVARAARAECDRAAAGERAALAAAAEAESARREAERRLQELRSKGEALRREAGAAAARLDTLDEQATRIAAEHTELESGLERLEAERAALPDPGEARERLETARRHLAGARAREAAARAEQAAISERASALAARREAILVEQTGWTERRSAAAARARDLTERRAQAEAEHAALAALPDRLAARERTAISALEAAELAHRAAASALVAAEDEAATEDRAARAAERKVASAREQCVRDEALLAQKEAALEAVDARIRERLGASATLPELGERANRPEAEEAARRRLERLLREREAMGPVNLRAEIEAAEVEERIGGIVRESEELASAIAKLRGSVGHINREGRARLSAMFTEVDRHFQALFARMFGGGRAHLALVGSEDPLAAGLEIYAQPPGKKLAQLSLLSGGEQALIALSLIFAVFRCNPAPIAVLDEVDAPLDDVNVGRFCRLVEDVVRECGTRIMIATHHPLTMARMDRLYGVTMQERGISRLISVDLAAAREMADPPRLAAE
jgi:chromosome segregation protein